MWYLCFIDNPNQDILLSYYYLNIDSKFTIIPIQACRNCSKLLNIHNYINDVSFTPFHNISHNYALKINLTSVSMNHSF